ncbi:MAG: nicotinate-nucleotide--dimethylbenzimidazole phosphoribosyltransferase [Planctomycetaceae bacterium]
MTASFTQLVQARLDSLTKPPGSLGRLEALALRLAEQQQTLDVVTRPRRLVLFAADHGVVAAGVSQWPSAVTAQMVLNIAQGGAASSVLARQFDVELRVVDVGVARDTPWPDRSIVDRRIRPGTRNFALEPALTVEEFDAAWQVGVEQAATAHAEGCRILLGGEMGIGNTTAASALTAWLTQQPAESVVGAGAGATDESLQRKCEVVTQAVARAQAFPEIRQGLASICGLEIAALAGFYAQGARQQTPVLLDGFIATSAALLAERLAPGTARGLLAAHRSAEPGHTPALAMLGLVPWIDHWQLRLGEGTGALLLVPLVDAAGAILTQMATFQSAGVAAHAD